MARYKVSGKNIYGLRARPLLTFGICIPVVIVAALIVEFFIAPVFYAGYAQRRTLPEGAVGQCSAEDTPLAASIADMERLPDGFTFYTSGTVLNHDTVRAGEVAYHLISLDSGERVVARINKKALTDTERVGIYRLPVGVWRPWTPPEEVLIFSGLLADTGHYIDMYGNYRPVASPQAYGHALGSKVQVWMFVLFLAVFRVVGVRRWRFAPMLLASRDPLLPRNDLECWCAATFAIWSRSFEGMEGFPLITGARGTRRQVRRFRESLAGQWEIRSREEGLKTVHELTGKWAGVPDARASGWDLCRATQLLGMMYLVGMLARDELDQEFSRAGRVIQRSFSSWEGLADSYLEGFRAWAGRSGYDGERSMAVRRRVYERLKGQSCSPYSIPWNTDLSWLPGVSGGERTFTKELMKRYRDDY